MPDHGGDHGRAGGVKLEVLGGACDFPHELARGGCVAGVALEAERARACRMRVHLVGGLPCVAGFALDEYAGVIASHAGQTGDGDTAGVGEGEEFHAGFVGALEGVGGWVHGGREVGKWGSAQWLVLSLSIARPSLLQCLEMWRCEFWRGLAMAGGYTKRGDCAPPAVMCRAPLLTMLEGFSSGKPWSQRHVVFVASSPNCHG